MLRLFGESLRHSSCRITKISLHGSTSKNKNHLLGGFLVLVRDGAQYFVIG